MASRRARALAKATFYYLLSDGDARGTVQRIKAFLSTYGEDAQALTALGDIYQAANNRSAIGAYNKALTHNERFTPALFGLAESYLAAGDLEEALLRFSTAINIIIEDLNDVVGTMSLYLSSRSKLRLKSGLCRFFSAELHSQNHNRYRSSLPEFLKSLSIDQELQISAEAKGASSGPKSKKRAKKKTRRDR